MVSSSRKHEARYQSNVDYYGSYSNALGHSRVKSIDLTQKGLINIKFEGLEKVSTLISPHGIIQIFFFTFEELDVCVSFLRKILVPRGERLELTPQGIFVLVDKIRRLIQDGKIAHDMSLDSNRLAELTGWEKEDIVNGLPTILKEVFPFGIELKASRIIAGCSRAEPYVEEWLQSVEQALRREGFYSPYVFEWGKNQSFEFVKQVCVGANYEAVIRVKAFLDGRILTQVEPTHLATFAGGILNAILDKYAIPYETELPVEMAKGPLILVAVLGIAALGALVLHGLSNIRSESFPEDEEKTCLCNR